MTINNANFGFRVPDVVANLRVDQAWGFAGISAALHDASGAYYNTPNVVNNGHPEDKYGWALAGGAKFNLQGGDMIGFNVCYSEGAAGMCTNQGASSSTTTATTWLGLDCRWCVQHRHPDRADQGVECSCRVRAHLEPEMADRGRWRLRQRRLQRDRNQHHPRAYPWGGGGLRCGGIRCRNPHRYHSATGQQLQPGLQLLGSLYPHPVEPGAAARYRSGGACISTQHRVQRPGDVAANGSRPAVINGVIDDQNVWSAMFRWQRNFYP